MKLVIDIPESTYRNIKYGKDRLTERDANNVINAIKNADDEIITETSMHHFICAMCDNDKCVRGTKECEFEQWKEKEKKNEEITTEYAIKLINTMILALCLSDPSIAIGEVEEVKTALNMAIKALHLFDKLDTIITKQIDISNNQIECQTLRWVLDKMSEVDK